MLFFLITIIYMGGEFNNIQIMLQMTCGNKKDKSDEYKKIGKQYGMVFFKCALSNTPSASVWRASATGSFHGVLEISHTTFRDSQCTSGKSRL